MLYPLNHHEQGGAALAYTFKGGIHVDEHKHTAKSKTVTIPTPPIVKVSMNQSIGAPATPTVKVGDTVKIGQVIGEVPESALGCPVHSSISGKVIAIEEMRVTDGSYQKAIVIESDGEDAVHESVVPYTQSISKASREEIIDRIRAAGITGMGGAAFPTYAKIKSAIGKAEYLIVNCAECEPFITADHRLLLEEPDRVIGGIKILLRAVGAPQAFVAIEDNKADAARKISKRLRGQDLISVKLMKTKYPQGDERQLIFALTGRELATGKLPADAGCVIFNAATCAAVYTAFAEGMPLVKRTLTVSGDCIKAPANLSVPIGTTASYLIEQCGGLVKTPEKMIAGGPMMGQAQWDRDMPTKKSTSSLLLLSRKYSEKPSEPAVCIRCGRCVKNCPMRLMPAYIAAFVRKDDMENAEKYGAMSCVECGSCSYNCPGKVEIVQYIRVAKNYIRTENARMKAAREASDKKD